MVTQALGRCILIPLIAEGPELSRATNGRIPSQQSCKQNVMLKWAQNISLLA